MYLCNSRISYFKIRGIKCVKSGKSLDIILF